MIQKPNSLEMMEKFNQAITDIDTINNTLTDIQNKMNTKLSIINACNTYNNHLAENIRLTNTSDIEDRIIFNYNTDKIEGGTYDVYGQTIHAAFVKVPDNVFNFLTETGPIYKDNASVEFYTDEEDKDIKYEYSDILKYESDTSKNDVFNVFDTDTFTMAVQVNIGNITGGTTFNMIEICPYLPGSFNIEEIRLFTVEQYLTQDLVTPAKRIDAINDVGAIRIALDNKYQLYRIEFDIRVNYQLNGYPFGIRHLYFLNTDADTESDYIVIRVDKNDYIESVGQSISIIKPSGESETTADAYGINYYLFYENGVLQTPLSNPIARNITSFYAQIPLKEPLIGIHFKEILTR